MDSSWTQDGALIGDRMTIGDEVDGYGGYDVSERSTTIRQIVDSLRNTSLSINFGNFKGQANGWVAVVVLGVVLIIWLR